MSVNPPDQSEGSKDLPPSEILERTAVSVAQKIVDQARKLHQGGDSRPVEWSEWSTANLEPGTPIRVGDLRTEFPELHSVLLTPSGQVEIDLDPPSDDETIRDFGYWRNPDGYYTGLQFRLEKSDDHPRTIRRVSIERQLFGDDLVRQWENIGWIRQHLPFTGNQKPTILAALEQTERLVDKVIASGNFDSSYHSHKEEVGLPHWQKGQK